MTKYGVAIAQSGTPIDRASDYQRIIDTRRKTMSVVARVPIEITDVFGTARTIKLYEHNLGYIPAFEAPFYSTRFEVGISHGQDYIFLADRTAIYFIVSDGAFLESGYTMTGNLTVYDLNMEIDYKGERSGILGSVSRSDRGIKIIGNDEYAAHDANDTDPIGFAMTTDSKAIGVEQIGTIDVTGYTPPSTLGEGIIPHELSYPPLVRTVQVYKPDSSGDITYAFLTFKAPSTSNVFYSQLQLSNVRVAPQKVIVQSNAGDTFRFVLFVEPTEIAG